MPLSNHDADKNIEILMAENRRRGREGKTTRSRAQIIAIALNAAGKGRKKGK